MQYANRPRAKVRMPRTLPVVESGLSPQSGQTPAGGESIRTFASTISVAIAFVCRGRWGPF